MWSTEKKSIMYLIFRKKLGIVYNIWVDEAGNQTRFTHNFSLLWPLSYRLPAPLIKAGKQDPIKPKDNNGERWKCSKQTQPTHCEQKDAPHRTYKVAGKRQKTSQWKWKTNINEKES